MSQEEEEEEITRCVCGEQEPADESGLYIQCEECSVWQHGYCVGIVEDVPDKYWCEKCKPELHDLYTDKDGRSRSHYLPVRNEQIDIQPVEEEFVQEATTQDTNESKVNEPDNDDETTPASSIGPMEDPDSLFNKRASRSAREEQQYQRMLEQAIQESKLDASTEDAEELILQDVKEDRSKSTEPEPEPELEPEITSVTETESQLEEPVVKKQSSEGDETSTPTKENSKPIKKSTRVTKNPRRTNSRRYIANKRTNSNSSAREKSSDVTVNDAVKPRLPSQRTTLNEMRRRTSAILEFISRTQWELENLHQERDDLIRFVENEQFVKEIDKIFSQNKETLNIMNELTQKLLNWEKNYSDNR